MNKKVKNDIANIMLKKPVAEAKQTMDTMTEGEREEIVVEILDILHGKRGKE